ncbi:Rha family transcriptional regulator [Acidovorax sp. A79]|uniref:Rha family transcriptional regulator n=1 Tax=Acidovorax sp. A79 TaxID=3056107 RepID=UPI0034E8467E
MARYFRKQHKHVLEKIANLLADLPADFAEPNFRLSEFTDSTGRTLPAYRLTRDGFTLLTMGFTGKKALAFKLAYIDAFNEMEAVIAEGKHAPERMNVAYAQAAAVAERAARTVFTAVMAGDDADWRGARWLFCLSASGQTQVIAVPHDALLLRLAELPRQMLEPGTSPTNRELVELAAACNQRLAQRMAHDARGLLN